LKASRLCNVAVFVLQLFCAAASPAQDSRSSAPNDERSKQEKIFQSKGDEVPGGYTVDRPLSVYIEFDSALARLGPQDRWLDIGAGRGQAILDYYSPEYDRMHLEGREQRGDKAQAVAMSIEDRRTEFWQQSAARLGANKISYLINKRLREYSLEELGKFSIITDMIGGFSYSENLSLFMEKVLGFLELNGSFYAVLQDVSREDGVSTPHYSGSPFLTEIQNADGSQGKVCSWLKSISCAAVTCESKAGWTPPIEAFRVRKVCNDISVPALAPIHYKAGTPPERKYRLAK
jgi:SAM-dependent methyltransferase